MGNNKINVMIPPTIHCHRKIFFHSLFITYCATKADAGTTAPIGPFDIMASATPVKPRSRCKNFFESENRMSCQQEKITNAVSSVSVLTSLLKRKNAWQVYRINAASNPVSSSYKY